MRQMLVVLTAVLLVVTASAPAQARDSRWCALYGDMRLDVVNCRFDTIEQCRANIIGIGGSCQENPFVSTSPRKKKD